MTVLKIQIMKKRKTYKRKKVRMIKKKEYRRKIHSKVKKTPQDLIQKIHLEGYKRIIQRHRS